MPILSGKLRNDIMVLKIPVSKEEGNELSVKHILIDFDKASDPSSLSLIQVFNNGMIPMQKSRNYLARLVIRSKTRFQEKQRFPKEYILLQCLLQPAELVI